MKTKILDICPDCGGDLDGDICKECDIKWKFANIENTDTHLNASKEGKNDN